MKGSERDYDGYVVGRRVLSLAPAWLLLVVVAFVLALLLFSWVGGRGGGAEDEAFRNEAMNRPAATPVATHADASPLKAAVAAVATPPATTAAKGEAKGEAAVLDEAGAYSVQVGAFAEVSRANEQVSRLRAAGFEARVVESREATRFRFQVRSRLYATREAAARLAAELRARGAAGDTVIVEPSGKED